MKCRKCAEPAVYKTRALCGKHYTAEWYKENRSNILDRKAVWRQRNRERLNAAAVVYNRKKKRQSTDTTPPHKGVCSICKETRTLYYDHDHTTSLFRGWLCTQCNTGLGLFKDSPQRLASAIAYLTGMVL